MAGKSEEPKKSAGTSSRGKSPERQLDTGDDHRKRDGRNSGGRNNYESKYRDAYRRSHSRSPISNRDREVYRKSNSRSPVSRDVYRRSRSRSPMSGRDVYRSSNSRSPNSGRRRHQGTRENPPPGRCIGVFGLSIYTHERDLKDVFLKYGPIDDVQIVYDAQTGRSRGFSFVYFQNVEDAQMVVYKSNESI